jgi:hypothetical protein
MTLRRRIAGAWWIAALLPALLASSTGCGRKGPPAVPRVVAPAAVEGVRAEPRGTGILLSWTRPTGNQDGSPLSDLLEFRIVRASGVMRGPGLPATAFLPLATVRADRPENASVQGSLYAFLDDAGGQGLVAGRQYRYRIQAINRDGSAGPASGEAVVDLLAPPPSPGALAGAPGDGTARLEWSAPSPDQSAEAPAVRGYNIYRGLRSGVHGPQPVNAAPQSDTRFLDTGLQNETTYYYVVRSVSGDAPPRGLVAVPGTDGIALTWTANAETDLLGYLVYRREPPTLAPVRLTDAPIGRTTFIDTGARSGVTYLYTITAVDRSVRQNESAPSAEVEASRP